MAATETRTCERCGEAFTRTVAQFQNRNLTGRFCSKACANKFRAKPINGRAPAPRTEHICEQCGRTYLAITSRVRWGRAHYCSRACQHLGWMNGEYRTCKTCGKQFYIRPCEYNAPHRTGEFCSLLCRGPRLAETRNRGPRTAEQKARQSATMRAKPRKPPRPAVSLTCSECGLQFQVSARVGAQKVKNHFTFCAVQCWYIFVRKHPEFSGHYYDGRSGEPYAPGWGKALKRRILARDGFLCQICGRPVLVDVGCSEAAERRNNVHHIDRNKRNHAPSNLITLCNGCHGRAHGPRRWWGLRLHLEMLMSQRIAGYLPPPSTLALADGHIDREEVGAGERPGHRW
jgi:hypothetical protein